ncbi:MAG: S-layer homology domain-containing protein [Nostocaceae cyanobacterium]|nr:S-layer homology domain-containing protein [Nostocaceae cyanobacterium]
MGDRLSESMVDYIMLGLLGFLGIIGFVANSQGVVAQQKSFPDVSADYWAEPFIQSLVSKGIIAGYPDGTFRPKQPIERDEFAAIIRQAFDKKQVKNVPSGSYFQDVPQGYWAASPIEEAYESGFMKAFPKNSFRPHKQLSKAEALIALTNALNLSYKTPTSTIQASGQVKNQRKKTKNRLLFPLASTTMMQPFYQIASASTVNKAKAPNSNTQTPTTANTSATIPAKEILRSHYQDAKKIPANTADKIAAATQANVVVNYPQANMLRPNQNINRSEAAALIHQALVYQGKLSPIDSQQKAYNYVVKFAPLKER